MKTKTKTNKNGAGRTSKATKETIDELFSALKTGNTRKDSCILAGISDETLANWIKGLFPPDAEMSHLDFLEQLAKAEIHAKNVSIAQVRRAGGQDWKASAWFLTHSPAAKQDWAERNELSGPGGTPLHPETKGDFFDEDIRKDVAKVEEKIRARLTKKRGKE